MKLKSFLVNEMKLHLISSAKACNDIKKKYH